MKLYNPFSRYAPESVLNTCAVLVFLSLFVVTVFCFYAFTKIVIGTLLVLFALFLLCCLARTTYYIFTGK